MPSTTDTAITWVHLSDFHAGQRGEPVWHTIERGFKDDLLEMAGLLGTPDLLLFTGDLAFKGAQDEYRKADELLARIRAWLGHEVPIFAVPGNHDLARPRPNDPTDYEILLSYEHSPRFAAKLWGQPPSRFMHGAFAEYDVWANRSMITPWRALGHDIHVSAHMPGDAAAVLAKSDLRLGLLGLNSAWVQFDEGDFEGKLQLPREQLHAALPNREHPLDWFDQVDATLLLTHHPHTWLSRKARDTYLSEIHTHDRKIALALYGHVHDPETMVVAQSGTAPRAFFQAPSLFGLERYNRHDEMRAFGYAWGRIHANGELRVWPRKAHRLGDGSYAFEHDTKLRRTRDELGGIVLAPARPAASGRTASGEKTANKPSTPDPDPDALACYRDYLRSEHETIQLFGFGPDGRVPLGLDGLFVELDAVIDPTKHGVEVHSSAMHAEQAKAAQGRFGHEQTTLAQAFTRARELAELRGLASLRGLVLLGDPGSGKTTHLRQLVLQVLDHGSASIGLPDDLVPVFIPLQALRQHIERGLGPLGPLLDALLPPDPSDRRTPDFGARLIKRGRVLLLFDGLDEVADADARKRVSQWIAAALQTMRDAYFVVTCRYAGYAQDVALPDHFLELHLRPLNDAQMRAFVQQWYGHAARALARTEERRTLDPTREATDLLDVLSSGQYVANMRVHELTRNPLLLTAICLVHLDRGRLPHERGKLYEKCISVLLERWQRRQDARRVNDDEALELMQAVAHDMHQRRTRWASTAELREPIRERLAMLGRATLDVDAFLTTIRDDAALLTGWGIDEFGFMHLGFQEWLAAKQLGIAGQRDVAVFAQLAARFDDSWWQEVILLLLAQRNPHHFVPVMQALLAHPSFVVWSGSELMQLCMTETAVFDASPFVHVLGRSDAEPALRRAVARLLRGRGALPDEFEGLLREPRVRTRVDKRTGIEFVRIKAGIYWIGSLPNQGYEREQPRHEVTLDAFELARTPVTNAQYRRYLEANPDASPPKHWADRNYNQPNQPVVGVSWHEAMAYCAWAGSVLPTEAQWEVACRAGRDTRYCNGDDEAAIREVGWYNGNSVGRLHAVAELQPNAWGLYDMHGNVWEWCLDGSLGHGKCEPYSTLAQPGSGLRREPDTVVHRVMRGGSFVLSAVGARSAYRFDSLAGDRSLYLGFRPARVIS